MDDACTDGAEAVTLLPRRFPFLSLSCSFSAHLTSPLSLSLPVSRALSLTGAFCWSDAWCLFRRMCEFADDGVHKLLLALVCPTCSLSRSDLVLNLLFQRARNAEAELLFLSLLVWHARLCLPPRRRRSLSHKLTQRNHPFLTSTFCSRSSRSCRVECLVSRFCVMIKLTSFCAVGCANGRCDAQVTLFLHPAFSRALSIASSRFSLSFSLRLSHKLTRSLFSSTSYLLDCLSFWSNA